MTACCPGAARGIAAVMAPSAVAVGVPPRQRNPAPYRLGSRDAVIRAFQNLRSIHRVVAGE